MKITPTLMLATTLCAGLLAAASAHANLITNGTFDLSVPNNGTGNGWASSNIDGAGGWRISGGNPDYMFILNESGGSSDPTIQQLVTGLIAGATYRLTGDYANHYLGFGSRGPETFAIDLDGVQWALLDHPGVPGQGTWGSFSFDILALDTDLLIGFRAEINGDDTDYKIDNIALNFLSGPVGGGGNNGGSIPEPSSLLLLGLGLMGMRLARKQAAQES